MESILLNTVHPKTAHLINMIVLLVKQFIHKDVGNPFPILHN